MDKLRGFGIKNFRSFDEEGVFLENIEKINIFIGKNNSGKSNVLRFLNILSEFSKNGMTLNTSTSEIENLHRRGKNDLLGVFQIDIKSLDLKEESPHFKELNETTIPIEYDFKNRRIITNSIFPYLGDYSFSQLFNENFGCDREKITLLRLNNPNVIKKLEQNFIKFRDLIYIPNFRTIDISNQENKSLNLDGTNIIKYMYKMQHPDIGEEEYQVKFNKIQKFVRQLLNSKDITIEIPERKDKMIVNMHGNRLPLESYGTGIHQIVILCSILVINENKIVSLEEPEVYLHPELQRKFLDFLINETNNIYFITTHSNVFIDYHDDIQINHVTYDRVKTSIEQLNPSKEILDDLGYKNSDLLQSNCIIWVEGPSDRTYINRWISLVDDSLKEGLHYSIMFYGGAMLSHLSITEDEGFINLLKINQHSFIVMDRDGENEESALKKRVQRIKSEFEKDKKSFNYWITKGREIENYLTKNSVNKWLSNESYDFKEEEDTKFEELINKSYSKARHSKEIVKCIESEDLDILDLKEQINNLVSKIREWNS